MNKLKVSTLLVDMMPLVYQAHFSVGHFRTKSGLPTGVIYGVMRALRSFYSTYKPERVVCCWDIKGPIIKATNHSEYKSNRAHLSIPKEEFYAQIEQLKELILSTRYDQVEAEGYEADDLLYTLSRESSSDKQVSLIVTVDRDLFQAVDDKTYVLWKAAGKDNAIMTPQKVKEDVGVSPHLYIFLKAITGDVSDNIDSFLFSKKSRDTATGILRTLDQKGFTYQQVKETLEGYMKLPALERFHNSLQVLSLSMVPQDKVVLYKGLSSESVFLEGCAKYEFKSLVSKIRDFI